MMKRGLGLHDYVARHYAQPLGRWITPDTVMPDPGNPQALNRYSYVLNNPLRFIDDSGKMPIDIAGGGGGGAGMAVAMLISGLAQTAGQQASALNVQLAPAANATMQTWSLAGNQIIAAGHRLNRAVQNAGQAGNTADPGGLDPNDPRLKQGTRQATQTLQSVWKLDPLKRGQEIERMLGRSPQLSQNFPVIDRFENGVATSIKSIDLGARSYQNIGTLINTVRGYANELAEWRGATWAGIQIDAHQITSRELLLATPQNATEAQLAALQQLQNWASTIGVIINTTVIP